MRCLKWFLSRFVAISSGFNCALSRWVGNLSCFIANCRVLSISLRFVVFYRILLQFVSFYRILLQFVSFYRILSNFFYNLFHFLLFNLFVALYRILSQFIAFCLALLHCTRFIVFFHNWKF